MASLKLACVAAVLCMVVVSAPIAHAAITCGNVAVTVTPCIGYIRAGGAVPSACCDGVKNLNSAAKTIADRKTVCNCLKQAANAISGYNDKNAAALPGKCGVSIPYKLSVSTNCATIKF